MRNINRRESPRIEIQLRCHVTSPALWLRSTLNTENISRSGLLIAWQGGAEPLPLPSLGQILTLELELPANHGFGQKCIHCQGTVLRATDSGRGYPLVALQVNYMDFRAFHDRLHVTEDVQSPAWMA
jgi:hypothetical protein